MSQRKNLSENIADKLKSLIIKGEYAVGERLPNEQELSVSLNVSRTTIREAVKLLVSLHVLEIVRGKGTFVATIPGLSNDPLGLDFLSDERLRHDLYIFRNTVEPEVCALAAANASASQIAELRKTVLKMENMIQMVTAPPYDGKIIDIYTDNEINFHTQVYQMTHNVVYERLINIISRAVTVSYTTLLYRTDFDLISNTKTHVALYDAIRERDSERARNLGRMHMKDFSRVFSALK